MTRNLPFLFSRIFNTPLMVLETRLQAFMSGLPAVLAQRALGAEIALPEPLAFDGDDLAPPTDAPVRPAGYSIRNGVATLPVHGVLVRRAGQMTPDCTPLMSYETLSKRLQGAMRDSRVRAILMDIDSPGGEAGGVMDLAGDVRAASQVKPVWAIANDDAFSAAYAIASAAQRVWATRTAGLGSIGVVAMHADQSQYDAKEGLQYSYIHAGAHKIDGHPHGPLTPAARGRIQEEVNRLHSMFVDTVAAHRGLSHEHVAGTEAGLYFGPEAIQARLADQIGTPEDAERALAAHVAPSRRVQSMSDHPTPSDPAPPAPSPTPIPMPPPPADAPQPEAAAEASNIVLTPSSAAEVVQLCIAAGRAAVAPDLLQRSMTIEQVRRHLAYLAAKDAATPLVPIDASAAATAAGPPLPKPITSKESFDAMRLKRS